ncbi:hypothetical protein FHH43_07685 [Clostridium perfringens]|nr:hypothetical protein [Clostridium perfringens]
MLEVKDKFDIEKSISLNYIVNLPEEYHSNQNKIFPVILFLHGIGERGDDIDKVKKYGIHRYLKDMEIPFIVISPQCHDNNFWDRHFSDIEILLEKVKRDYRADMSKVCITGVSLGAYGAWNFVMQRPNLFSSIVSIAGGSMLPKYAESIKHIPAYIAHGSEDREVDVNESIKIAKALASVGGKVELNIVPKAGHKLCTKIFEDSNLYKWIANNN